MKLLRPSFLNLKEYQLMYDLGCWVGKWSFMSLYGEKIVFRPCPF